MICDLNSQITNPKYKSRILLGLNMDQEELKQRTKEFAKRVIRLCQSLPKTFEAGAIGHQLFRSGTSVGANYRSALRGRSKAEFISKLSIVVEEADESLYWMELLVETAMVECHRLDPLMKETSELVAIFVATIKTLKGTGRLQVT